MTAYGLAEFMAGPHPKSLSLVIYQLSFSNWIKGGTVKELNETGAWLLTILEARMVPESLAASLVKENRELACMDQDRTGQRLARNR